MSQRLQRLSVALLLGLLLAAGVGLSVLKPKSRHDFSSLVDKLESGEIVCGDSVGLILGMGKPRMDLIRTDPEGRRFGVSVHWHDLQALFIYYYAENRHKTASLFAAQFVSMHVPYVEKWYFCDQELMSMHMSLSNPSRAINCDAKRPVPENEEP